MMMTMTITLAMMFASAFYDDDDDNNYTDDDDDDVNDDDDDDNDDDDDDVYLRWQEEVFDPLGQVLSKTIPPLPPRNHLPNHNHILNAFFLLP